MSNWLFGFEIEGFYQSDGKVQLPPKNYPTDSFPGLVEFRTSGGLPLAHALADVKVFKYHKDYTGVNTTLHEHVFTSQERLELRNRSGQVKTPALYTNLYGRKPRALGNKTLASFQINVSLQTRSAYVDSKGVSHSAAYSLFDFVPIVRALDKLFEEDIKKANRTPGWYSIKDRTRLEYRSLPNFVYGHSDMGTLYEKLSKIFT